MPAGVPAVGRNTWTDSDEKLLLLLYGLKQTDWKWIAEKMGSTYSPSAIAQKHGKLMRAAEAKYGKLRDTDNTTPVKRVHTTATGSNKKGQSMAGANGDDGKVQTRTPNKRPRAAATASAKKSSAASSQDEDSEDSDGSLYFKAPNKKIKGTKEDTFVLKPDPGFHDVGNDDLYH